MKELIRANEVSRFIFSEKICFPFFYYKTEEFLFSKRFFAAQLNVLFIT